MRISTKVISGLALVGLTGGCSLFKDDMDANTFFRAPPKVVESTPMNTPGMIIEDDTGCYHAADSSGAINPLTGPDGQLCE